MALSLLSLFTAAIFICLCNGRLMRCRAQDDWFIHYRSANVSNDTDRFFSFPFFATDHCCLVIRPVICSICVFLSRRLVLGYAYPAYDCYKMVELNRPEVEQLRFWCQYWFVRAPLLF